ncbi:MAG: MotA/TolQ/ExbB proton channel family protein [Pirellulales bacterium]|nr:MotA/TolQ/ExbB proton channel family protein [Pirellulales bacterium]
MHPFVATVRRGQLRPLTLRLLLTLAVILVLVAGHGTPALAQPDDAGSTATNQEQAADANQASFWQIVLNSGPVGIVILLLSIGGAALVVEHVIHIRARVLMPTGLSEKVRETLKTGHVAQALQECQAEPSLLSYIIQSGLAEIDGKWTSIEKAMEDATAEQSARLYRKVEYLSVIGNLAPMLGLLGTVIGMVMAFRDVSTAQGAPQAKELAEGIYLALVTTVEGLIVAIPALAAFAYFRNRVDQLVAETAQQALHVFTPFKRSRLAGERSR